jgi:4a-hydroxytetrahydrobiopterin dehydratase
MPPLTAPEIETLKKDLSLWTVVNRDNIPRLERVFSFPDFAEALAFAVRVGAKADEQDHHPSLLVEWGRVTVTWWTHKIRGLHRNDAIMAAQTDLIFSKGEAR